MRMETKKKTKNVRKEILGKIDKTLEDFSISKDQSLSDISESQQRSEVLLQLRDVGWSNVVECNDDFSQITFSYSTKDVSENGENLLLLKVTIPKNFPFEGPICEDDFPESFSLQKYVWISDKSSLAQIYSTFVDRVQSLVPVSILKNLNKYKFYQKLPSIILLIYI